MVFEVVNYKAEFYNYTHIWLHVKKIIINKNSLNSVNIMEPCITTFDMRTLLFI